MIDKEEKNRNTARRTLLDMYHPVFREGYQAGRQQYFQEQIILTDKQLVELLQLIVEEGQQEDAEKRDEGVYYAIGRLVGQMSGGIIPRQPHEDNTREVQDAFLIKVMRENGATGQALIETIRQFWAMQDQLAQTLEADTFEQMLNRGIEKCSCL